MKDLTREIEVMARLDHPHIVKLYGITHSESRATWPTVSPGPHDVLGQRVRDWGSCATMTRLLLCVCVCVCVCVSVCVCVYSSPFCELPQDSDDGCHGVCGGRKSRQLPREIAGEYRLERFLQISIFSLSPSLSLPLSLSPSPSPSLSLSLSLPPPPPPPPLSEDSQCPADHC